MPADTAAVLAAYADRRTGHLAAQRTAARQARRLSWARLLLFAAGVAALWWRWPGPEHGPSELLPVLAPIVVAYLVAARLHRRVQRAHARHRALAEVLEEGAWRVERRWDRLPLTAAPAVDADHPYGGDLSITGRASLLQLLGPLGASTGAATATGWLLRRAEPPVIRERQEAVRALVERPAFRDELTARARLAGAAPRSAVQRFLAWCDEAPWLLRRPALLAAAYLVPALTVGTCVALAAGLLPGEALWLPIVVGLLVTGVGRAGSRLARGAPGSDTFRLYGEQFRLVLAERVPAAAWQRLQAALGAGGHAAPAELQRLQRLLEAAELRYSPLMHGVVNALFAWDLHVLAALERWRQRDGAHAAGWFAALGEAEALVGFATLAADNPGWCLPELRDDGEAMLHAEALGHPLLPPASCVPNDVEVGAPGTFLLVTGSNMAGKTTLLRSIGANAVLAQAGAPACARRLVLPPLRVYTSMRVSDSLEAGVSLFMAELLRLRGVVNAARDGGPVPVLFLLDEMLHGTNTAERQVAARRILAHLLRCGAVGAVSTHDLELGDTAELRAAAQAVHFREEVSDGKDGATMSFDYVLREGPASSANALKLVELMGLG